MTLRWHLPLWEIYHFWADHTIWCYDSPMSIQLLLVWPQICPVLELSLCTTPSSHLNGRAIIIHASLLIPTTYSSVPCVWYRSYKYNMISIASRKSPGVVYSSTTVREYLYFSRQKTELLVTVNPVEKKYYILYTQSIDYCKI